jgi:hypothetical protein
MAVNSMHLFDRCLSRNGYTDPTMQSIIQWSFQAFGRSLLATNCFGLQPNASSQLLLSFISNTSTSVAICVLVFKMLLLSGQLKQSRMVSNASHPLARALMPLCLPLASMSPTPSECGIVLIASNKEQCWRVMMTSSKSQWDGRTKHVHFPGVNRESMQYITYMMKMLLIPETAAKLCEDKNF